VILVQPSQHGIAVSIIGLHDAILDVYVNYMYLGALGGYVT
jgi:hypothetical protein